MSECITVTVISGATEVTVSPLPYIDVIIDEAGVQGPPGEQGLPGTGGITGNFYPLYGNPSGYITSGSFLRFSTFLNSGVESQLISFPFITSQLPSAVDCQFQNDVDGLIYYSVISRVNISGFTISFSDNLATTGYKINTIVGI